jgi:hypothetical protein
MTSWDQGRPPARIARALLRASVLVTTAIGCLAAAGPASAGQIVWEKNSEIWAMDDNGQNQRPLITLADAPGMSYIGNPHLHPVGGQTVAFTGSTRQNSTTFGSRTYSGNNSTGIYRWTTGATVRLSPEPSRCETPSNACTTFQAEPEIAADGTYVFQAGIALGDGNSTDFSYRLERGSLTTGESTEFPTQCSNENSGLYYGAEAPSPNPVNPAEVAYAGCDPEPEGSDYGIWIKTASGSPTLIADSADTLSDPSWTLDGAAVLVAARGSGIYRVPRDGSSATLVFAGDASSPRDMGDRILFESGFELYAIPSSCSGCTTGAATQLTTGGDSGAAAWTSAPAFQSGGGGGGGGGGSGGGGGLDTTAPGLRLSFGRAKLAAALTRGVPLTVQLDEGATVRVKLSLKGVVARRYGLSGAKNAATVTIGQATKSLATGRWGLRVRIAKKHARKLRAARSLKLQATVTATDAAGNEGTKRRSVKLKR